MSERPDYFNPFPGLRPFTEDEDYLFFGREAQSTALLRRLRQTRFLAVVGTSGSGKSSLVLAGVLPALHGGVMTRAGSRWRVALLRPGSNPIGALALALSQPHVLGMTGNAEEVGQAIPQTVIIETTLRRSALGLVEVVQQARRPAGENLLVVVDQFEELFRFKAIAPGGQGSDDATAFVKLLLEASRVSTPPLYIMLTMRSDFLGDCAQFRDLPEAINNGQFLIPRVTRDQRRQAIEGPVAVGGATMNPRLVQRLLNDVGDNPDQLPILQHALMRTWENWQATGAPALDLPHYEASGGMDEALSQHADEVFTALPDNRTRTVAEKLFRALTDTGTDHRGLRRPSRLEDLCAVTSATKAEVVTVIEAFRQPGSSFLVPPVGTELRADSVVDISHESLMRVWKKLKAWAEEEAQSARIYRRLAETAGLHQEGKAGLWRDPDLQVALDWRDKEQPNEAWAKRYHEGFEQAMRFLEASVARRDGEARAQEAQRQEQEAQRQQALEQAQKLAVAQQRRAEAEQQRAEEQARASRRLRWLTVGLALALIVAVGAAVYARRQALIANLGEQAAQARLASFKNPVAGLVWSIKLTAESQNTLHRVLDSVRATLSDLLKISVESNIFTGHKQNVTSVAFSPDGKYIASGSEDKTVRLWDVRGNPVSKPFLGHTEYVNAIAFSPQGDHLVTGSSDMTLRLWDLKGNPIREFEGHQGVVRSVAFSADGEYIVSGGDDGMRLWESNGHVIQTFLQLKGQPIKAVAFSPDGQTLVIARDTVQFWNREGNSIGEPIKAHIYGVSSLAISPDGKYIVTSGMDGTVKLIDFDKKTIVKTIPESVLHIDAVAFSPDSKFIAIAGGNTVLVRDSLEGKLIGQPFLGHEDKITSVAFSRSQVESYYIVTGSWDKTVRLWDQRYLTEQLPNAENDKVLLTIACNKLLYHPALVKEKIAGKMCQTEVWDQTQNAQFLVEQGSSIALQGNVDEATAKFNQALKLNAKLDINPKAEAKRLAALAQSEKEENLTLSPVNLIPNMATYGQVRLTEFTLNNKGNVISTTPGAKISVAANYIYDCPECQRGSINQIIVGIGGENSAQACIYNGDIKGSGASKFTLTAPKEPGTYYIRFRYAQAYGCEQGALGWWRVGNEPTAESNIGIIVVGK